MAEEDLIFGKNRHFFGGIEPSIMLAFNVVKEGNAVKITATLPGDTVINNQTLCTVEGAIIRRKTTDYPKDEFDGDLVADIKASTTFVDTTASATGTYYYAAFPYTTQGVYNRNKANRKVINEPEPMQQFTAKSVYVAASDRVTVEITAKLPSGVSGAVIRRSTSGYPATENEGTLFKDIKSNGTYTDSDVTVGVTYYYSAFPYTSTGAYNRSEVNRVSVVPKKRDYFFGYDLVKSTENPSIRVTYPSDVDNANFSPARMAFGSYFSYGGWNFAPGEKFMPRPCMLTYAGKVDHYLNPNDYTKKTDGTASKVADISFGGNAMMEWPKIWVKRWESGSVYHFRCSDIQIDSDYECWCNYDRQNHQIDHFYTPIYFGSKDSSNRLRSISGAPNSVSTTADTEINYAKANGADWYTEVLADRLLIQDLLVMMAKSTDGQTIYGSGRSNSSNSSAIAPGSMNTRGMFWGSNNGTDGVKVFGMENLWGNLWRRTAGWINDKGTQKVKLTRGTHDGTTATDYNTDGSGYKTVSLASPSGTSGGYISMMKTEAFGRIPVTASGSSSTYEADGLWFNNSQVNYAFVGGWDNALLCGPFCAFLSSAASLSNSPIGAALSCKPLAAA